MPSSKFKSRTDECETLLATIRGGVLVHLQDGLLPTDLTVPLDSARQLYELAADSDDPSLSSTADVLAAWLALLAAESGPISDTRARSLLDQVTAVEAALLAYKNRSDSGSLDVVEFVDESFFELETRNRRQAPVIVDQPVENFEVDNEMAEVFREEAESLIQNIRVNLDILAVIPNDRNALWEIKRNAHTFKGAAGIVGFKRASEVAHRIESLLGRLSQKEDGSNSQIVSLLLDATDCLAVLSDPQGAADSDTRYATLCRAFDQINERTASASETTAPSDPPVVDAVRNPASIPNNTTGKSRIIRVSLDRIDELVGYLRDLVDARPRLAEELSNLGTQLKEARSNYYRLRTTSARVNDLTGSNSGALTNAPGVRSVFSQSAYELAETTRDAAVINAELAEAKKNLEELTRKQHSLLDEMEYRLLRLRKVEFGTISTRLQRTVGVTCDEEGKRAELSIETPSVEVDTQLVDLLIEPLMHLLKNAIVHGIEYPEVRRMLGKPETGRITVRVDNRGRDLVLKVSDDGRGVAFQPLLDKAVASGIIADSERDQLTRRRLHDLLFVPGLTTAERLTLNAGRGVGMSIVREAVAAAGGVVEVETSAQRGTTFMIVIPSATDNSVRVPQQASEMRGAQTESRGTILIVDDSPSVRITTSRLLETAGWQTVTANNGLEALDRIRDMSDLPVAVLSDIEMPLMSGYDLIGELRGDGALREVPVIFVSSRSGDDEREKALAAGAEDYIMKPYEDKKLLAVVDHLAASREGILAF